MTTTCDQPARRASPRDHADWLALARTTAAGPDVDDPDGRYAGRPQARAAEALRRAGLLTLPIPAHHGGGGACWRTAYQVVREVAAVNGDIGLLLGHHYLLTWTPALLGAEEARERVWPRAAAGAWLLGGAPDPRETAPTLVTGPRGGLHLDGATALAPGAVLADRLSVGATRTGTGEPLMVLVDPAGPGVVRAGDAEVRFAGAAVNEDDVIGRPPGARAASAALIAPAIQLMFAQLYVGIAEGALNAARAHAVARTRPWPLGQARRNGGDAYLSGAYGGLLAQVRAARALADQAVEELSPALHGADGAEPSGRGCGAPAVLVATAKIAAVQAALAVASRVFELAGPGSARSSPGLARFWRYARALDDPVAYRQTEVGREFLTGEFPPERKAAP
ncbi:acyl-CoA dehydrogenase family protein [Actinomadura opuntiae]|uniref:acyl-CoA dehydrogenase family protein n=1 Tax=Actinomadura sp. OS1-43 TaxID=604315 RepID=UPI00255ABEE3|nr:acyl-CoA dehydrogenase family protein [Actinomadura sp. OS1-43]MDL4814194.1 acyl-CoA dehydrogenase family protein [Actinomadura sp. OS1-43]